MPQTKEPKGEAQCEVPLFVPQRTVWVISYCPGRLEPLPPFLKFPRVTPTRLNVAL